MSQAQAIQLLKEGIAAARAGNKDHTRRLLRQVTELDPRNEVAWLWLASVAESPCDALTCLERVLEINPANERALSGLPSARLQAAVAATKAGDKVLARRLLQEVTRQDGTSEVAWLCMASVAESPEESLEHLQRVLEINPKNEKAVKGIAYYRSKLATAPAAAWKCPLCQGGAARPLDKCVACGAVLTLANPDAFWSNTALDRNKVRGAAERLEVATTRQSDFATHYYLGLALLNLHEFDAAVEQLQTAQGLKPADRPLRVGLQALTQRQAAQESAARKKAAEEAAARRRSILVVDDSPTVRKLVAMTMERQGHQVTGAADGYEAIDQIRKVGVPDLVLLDINMPGMDGYQLCKLLRQNPDTAQVPIVMLSGKDGFFSKIRGRMAGSAEYITKPFQPETLVQAVEKHCGIKPAAVAVP